jgi:hypothetical protein
MPKDIKFINVSGFTDIEQPKPASSYLPEWYKNMPSYVNNKKAPKEDHQSPATIKRCMPVFDALTAGYIITSATDVYVSKKDGDFYFQWPALDMISFHNTDQAPTHPAAKDLQELFPKWINPWKIETPSGYSCFITQPLHRDLPFKILEGFVDTDKHSIAVNFPFVMTDLNFEGIIPAGTPIAQIIPIRRESWKMSTGNEKDIKRVGNDYKNFAIKFFDRYKTAFWTKKDYK